MVAAILLGGLAMAGIWFRGGGRPSDAELLRLLAEHRAGLAEVGDALLAAGPGAQIDIREAGFSTVQDRRHLAALQAASVKVAVYDGNAGGVLFLIHDAGISVSGLSMGLLYAPTRASFPAGATEVQDLTAGFAAARARGADGRVSDLLLIRPVDAAWALFLETH